MTISGLLIIGALVFAYALFSKSLADRSVSGPMVFSFVGLALGLAGVSLVSGEFEGGVEVLAEATLVVLLFSDATRIDLSRLRSQSRVPRRLLGIGLPLTVIAGTAVGVALLPGLGLLEAAVLAAVLSPTDAALGQAVVTDTRVPIRIRQALNVESGLNDGVMVPMITILIALATAGSETTGDWVSFVARQIGFGIAVGVVVGGLGGWLVSHFVAKGWVEGALRQIGVLTIAVMAFTGADLLEGNGFVAAFIAGLAFGTVARPECESATDFAEDQGQLLVLLTFLFWGALLVAPHIDQLSFAVAGYVVLSLTVVRMLPVAISMLGLGFQAPTTAYLGWFGPRGLASILFGLFAFQEIEGEAGEMILLVVTWTCLASVIAHGLTAVPFTGMYRSWFAGMESDDLEIMGEAIEVEPMRTRSMASSREPVDGSK